MPLARALLENEDELPIITMLLDDYYQQVLHAPVVPPEPVQPKAAPRPKPPARKRSGRSRRR